MLSKCRFDGAEGTVLRTMRCRMRDGTTSATKKLAREIDETRSGTVKLARKTDESTSDVINTVEVPQTQYIDRVRTFLVVRGR